MGRSLSAIRCAVPVVIDQRGSLSLSLSFSPVRTNVMSNIYITYLCLNHYFDGLCKCLSFKPFMFSSDGQKERNKIEKGSFGIGWMTRFGEFCNQKGVFELMPSFCARPVSDRGVLTSDFPFLFTCQNLNVLSSFYITYLCLNGFVRLYLKSLTHCVLQIFQSVKRGVLECKRGEMQSACTDRIGSFGIRMEFWNYI